jgi:hypothetical protein
MLFKIIDRHENLPRYHSVKPNTIIGENRNTSKLTTLYIDKHLYRYGIFHRICVKNTLVISVR